MLNGTISHYKILAQLGASSMGEVYKAEDLQLKRLVALKILPAEALLAEARAAAALNHPNIATIYELAQSDDLSYIVMEYIEGETLAERLRQGPVEIVTLLNIAVGIAEALKTMHARALIHCDIKSANIMLTREGNAKLLDFGLARSSACPAGQLAAAVVMGTAGYLSPEQARGEPLDGRSDLFSLGVVIYEMATGRLPFGGDSPAERLRALLNDVPQALGIYRPDAPLELESIVRRALKTSRDERYADVDELRSDLVTLRDQLMQEAAGMQAAPAALNTTVAAFRGLLPFQETDRERFYGREIETRAIFDLITHSESRFAVLFGESGSGKTSLVRAGLMPRLWEAGYVTIYCRSYKDPVAAVLAECRKHSHAAARAQEAAPDYLRRVTRELGLKIMIVCDQFEEFFISFPTEAARAPFISLVADCCQRADLPVRFLFSLRADFLYHINLCFAAGIAEPLASSRLYHLRSFTAAQAAEIITRSAQQARLALEPELIAQVAEDLAVNGAVLPSELQIVGEQLQNRRVFTLLQYRQVGGKERLVHSFLEDVIQASGDRPAAQLLLRCLISEENTRLLLPLDEIARRTQCRRQTVARLLTLFVQSRLIRVVQEEEPWRYELMHEYLIEKINRTTEKVMDATQRANWLLRQYLATYAVDPHTYIPLRKLWTIRRYADQQRAGRAQELLRRSLRRVLLQGGLLMLLLALTTVVGAAVLSVSDKWEETRLSDGHSAAVRQIAFSPDGRLLVSVGEDARVLVWDFARRERLSTLTGHGNFVTAVAFSPDGQWFATGSDDRSVAVWDSARHERVALLTGHQEKILTVGFSPDGRLLASASPGRTLLWRVGSWERVSELPIDILYGSLHFSPDSRQLLAPDGRAWDLDSGRQVADSFYPRLDDAIDSALARDASRALCVDSDGWVHFTDLRGRRALGSYRAHQDNGRAAVLSPDGRWAATGSEKILLWDATTQQKIDQLEYTAIVWGLAFSPDSRWLISSHSDGAIIVWDVAERAQVAKFNEHIAPVSAVAFSLDGQRLASVSEDRSVIVWNTATGQKDAVLMGHDSRVVAVAFAPDGRSVASTDFYGKVIFWDIATRQPRWIFQHPEQQTRCLAISPDGRWLVTSRAVHKASDGQIALLFPNGPYSAAFSADSRLMAGVTPDSGGKIFVWDVERGQRLEQLSFTDMKCNKVAITADGRQLVTGEEDGALRLWTVGPLREQALIGRHNARVKSIAFLPDGKELVSASDDQTIALWDVGKRRLMTRIGSHTGAVLSVAISADGRRLASGEEDRSVRVYQRHRMLWGYKIF